MIGSQVYKPQIKDMRKKATFYRKSSTEKKASKDFLGAILDKDKENQIRLLIKEYEAAAR